MEVVEKFLSIDGEGPTAGELAVFIRLKGCNLRCSWCDTTYSLEETAQADSATAEELYRYVKSMPAHNVTLTGGEPLLHPGVEELLALLNEDPALQVHVETNGSVDLRWWKKQFPWVSFVVDFKLPESGEMEKMDRGNLRVVDNRDVYKFVIASRQDLEYAAWLVQEEQLCQRTAVHFSPVLGKVDPAEIVEYMKEKGLSDVKLQMQIHKLIWKPDQRGV